jgi:hypothetical protein
MSKQYYDVKFETQELFKLCLRVFDLELWDLRYGLLLLELHKVWSFSLVLGKLSIGWSISRGNS